MKPEIDTSAKNTYVMALSHGQVGLAFKNCSVLKTAYILPENQCIASGMLIIFLVSVELLDIYPVQKHA